jgi:hypothetical protein
MSGGDVKEQQTIERRIEETQARLLELQAELDKTISTARWLLTEAADEHRRLRADAENVNLKVYTEEEAAVELKIGKTTLRRLRTSHREWPCFRPGDLVRYSNLHLLEIIEILDRRRKQTEGKGRAKRA